MADKEIFSLAMDNLEDFPVDLDDNDENFNVNLDNEDRNFNLSATQDDEDFEVEFGEVTNLGTTDYNKLQNKPQINGVTLEENKTSSDLGLQPSGDYALSSEIPTKTSDIENDSGFITNEVNNLVNYYTKTQVDNKVNVTWDGDVYTTVQDTVDRLKTEFADALDTKQNEITSSNKLASDLVDDTNQTNKFVTSTDITNWNNKADISDIPDVSGFITKDVNDLTYYTKTSDLSTVATSGSYNDLKDKPDLSVFATKTELESETTDRENADIGLQEQIDAITSSSDVKDIVGTYQELQDYDTSTLGNDDIIKVLQDSTHSNAMTYYRWVITAGVGAWSYIGQEGPYYTKSESDTLLNAKQNQITSSNKLDSDLVSDTNQTNKFVTSQEKTTWNSKYNKPSTGIPKTDLASDVQTSLEKADSALQSITSSDVTSALGYTPYNSTNPAGYTSNIGTITSVKMNGTTVASSGEADLGTVITQHQSLDDCVKKTGGSSQQTISLTGGTGTTALGVKSMSGSSYISMSGTGGWLGSYGVSSSKKPVFYNGTGYELAYTSDITDALSSYYTKTEVDELVEKYDLLDYVTFDFEHPHYIDGDENNMYFDGTITQANYNALHDLISANEVIYIDTAMGSQTETMITRFNYINATSEYISLNVTAPNDQNVNVNYISVYITSNLTTVRLYDQIFSKDNIVYDYDFVQETGSATNKAMSQKATTDLVNNTKVYYGTCDTAATTRAKEVTCDGFALHTGAMISVKFTNAQTYNGAPYLNVNNTGNVTVQYKGGTNGVRYMWNAGAIIDFTYDGTYWVMHRSDLATTSYYGITKLYTSAASDSQAYALTPRSLYYFANYSIAPYYSSSKTYAVGDKVRYSYYIYKCITAIPVAEAWNAEHWEQIDTIQEQIDNIYAYIDNLNGNGVSY